MHLFSLSGKRRGLTLVEVLVVIASLAFLAVVILPVLVAAKKKSARMGCMNHLQAMGLA